MNSNSRIFLVAPAAKILAVSLVLTGIIAGFALINSTVYADAPMNDKQVVATYSGHSITMADVTHEIETKPQ